MKILMICTEKLPVPPVYGGAIQTYIAGILPILSKAHDITVLGVNHPALPDTETIEGVKYVRIPGSTFDVYQEEVVRYLQSNQYDYIHMFNRPRLVLPVRKVAPYSKLILSMHNDMFTPEKINPEEASAAIAELSKIITISKYVGNVIKNLYPQAAPKLQHIYSGVDANRFLPGDHPNMRSIRSQIRKEHGLENKTVILFAGRLSFNKGVDRLVRALPALSKKFDNLALVIVGSKWFSQDEITDYIAYVKALAKKVPVPVVATGFVSPSEIQNWYAAADLFVCTSVWQEPVARVHYEAMAAGLPIVTTARGGNPEVVSPGENGLIVETPENPAEFEEKITTLLSNKALMKKMGEKGRELALSLYKWERVASEVLQVWAQVGQESIETSYSENYAGQQSSETGYDENYAEQQSSENGYEEHYAEQQSGENDYDENYVGQQSGENGYDEDDVGQQSGENGYDEDYAGQQSGENEYDENYVGQQSGEKGYDEDDVWTPEYTRYKRPSRRNVDIEEIVEIVDIFEEHLDSSNEPGVRDESKSREQHSVDSIMERINSIYRKQEQTKQEYDKKTEYTWDSNKHMENEESPNSPSRKYALRGSRRSSQGKSGRFSKKYVFKR